MLATGHNTDKKTVTLNLLGKGKRPVRVGYIQETPVWKTSYRLVLDDKDAPFLQGWAIVENTTEEDWNDVTLTLVSGRPISFTMDLYQPLYVPRPAGAAEAVRLAAAAGLWPGSGRRTSEFARVGSAEQCARRQAATMARVGKAARWRGGAADAARRRRSGCRWPSVAPAPTSCEAVADLQSRRQSLGPGRRRGRAVPIRDRHAGHARRGSNRPCCRSSTRAVKGEKVSIYNAGVQAKHPLNGLRLTNSTDLHLMQGPITVFDGGAYAGDAKIEDLPPGTERLISYALDLNTEVAPGSQGPARAIAERQARQGHAARQPQADPHAQATRSRTPARRPRRC